MSSYEEVPLNRKTVEAEVGALADYFIGFVKISANPNGPDAQLAGSGTLVIADGVHAILTADHVLQHLPTSGQIGLILTTRFQPQAHHFTLSMDHTIAIQIGRGSVESRGPDLGFLVLPSSEASRIPAGKLFYNLRVHEDAVLRNPLPHNAGLWCLCGMADEWTSESAPERGYERIKVFRGMYAEGQVLGESQEGPFDYIDFGVQYAPGYEGPQSFAGYSGGGLWQIGFRKAASGEVIADRYLSGVAFYQSPLVEQVRVLKCHGRRSVYELAVGQLERMAQQGLGTSRRVSREDRGSG